MSLLSVIFLIVTATVFASLDSHRVKGISRLLSRLSCSLGVVVWADGGDTKGGTRGPRRRIVKRSLPKTMSDPQENLSVEQRVRSVQKLVDCHQTASLLSDLIRTDGAGSWPPVANHIGSTWPLALRPYREIYEELGPYLAVEKASLNDAYNIDRIVRFRARFRALLKERVDVAQVRQLLDAAEDGRWDAFPRSTYNAFYSCIAHCRHAYRWGVIPCVRAAQREDVVFVPEALQMPWLKMQKHFGLECQSGNIMSNIVLNFDREGNHMLKINQGLPEYITSTEEAFSRILYEVEVFALPIYCDMVQAVVSFERGDKFACANAMTRISKQLGLVTGVYFRQLHDKLVKRIAWLSSVQGFFAWSAGHYDDNGELIRDDGLSGNQVLLFIAMDAFLGIETYLDEKHSKASVPIKQRKVAEAFRRHSFRHRLEELGDDDVEARIHNTFGDIVKQLRLFRAAHRSRSKLYLAVPSPERAPMTAGKSLLKPDVTENIQDLDQMMLGRLLQTL